MLILKIISDPKTNGGFDLIQVPHPLVISFFEHEGVCLARVINEESKTIASYPVPHGAYVLEEGRVIADFNITVSATETLSVLKNYIVLYSSSDNLNVGVCRVKAESKEAATDLYLTEHADNKVVYVANETETELREFIGVFHDWHVVFTPPESEGIEKITIEHKASAVGAVREFQTLRPGIIPISVHKVIKDKVLGEDTCCLIASLDKMHDDEYQKVLHEVLGRK